jgi:hypothetical protein
VPFATTNWHGKANINIYTSNIFILYLIYFLIFQHFPLLVNPIDQFSFVGSDLEEFVGDGEEEENEEEDEEEDKNDARKKTKCHEANPIYGNRVGVHFEAPTQPKMLTRKTTRDSGYQGSDTQSPAG